MCGISGIVHLREPRPVDEALLRRMNDTLSHRGPDADGFHIEPGVGLGHRRLSIIDLSGGAQPLYNEDGSIVVTYNGEIYNYRQLVKELERFGHRFRTHSDTEVIVHAFEQWGVRCLDRFNGMFAFALWDRRSGTVLLARDRLGIKPLYYTLLGDGQLVFASELKAILRHPGVDRTLDMKAVEEFFAFGYSADPRSIFESVKKLEAGTYLELRRGDTVRAPVRYWDVPLDRSPTETTVSEQLLEELRSRLKHSVELQLVSDVPLGAFLSGGIDSSAVVAMMRELSSGKILTCSIGFKEPQYDESRYATLVAEQKRTDHKSEIVEASDYALLDDLVGIYDEPYADSSAIPTYRVCELARRHVTVALSGDGGDENFVGYRRYKLFSIEEKLRSLLPHPFRRAVFGPLGRWYPKLDWAPRVLRGKTTFQGLARTSMEAYLHGVSIFPEEGRQRLYSDKLLADLQGYRAREVFARHLDGKEFSDALRMVQYLDFKTYLPCDILTKVDRASMAHSLEVRVPILDHEFVEWVAGVDTSAKLRRGEGKHVFKEALRPLLPADILHRPKMGFGVPIDIWFRKSLRQRIADTVTGRRLKECGLFKPEALDRLVHEHHTGQRNHKPVLWSLLMFDGFLKSLDAEPRCQRG